MYYDYIVVGAGLFGSAFANIVKNCGKKVLVIEKNNHIGGACYTEEKDGVIIHKCGPHIFHTSDKEIWDWVNQFDNFIRVESCTRVIQVHDILKQLRIFKVLV